MCCWQRGTNEKVVGCRTDMLRRKYRSLHEWCSQANSRNPHAARREMEPRGNDRVGTGRMRKDAAGSGLQDRGGADVFFWENWRQRNGYGEVCLERSDDQRTTAAITRLMLCFPGGEDSQTKQERLEPNDAGSGIMVGGIQRRWGPPIRLNVWAWTCFVVIKTEEMWRMPGSRRGRAEMSVSTTSDEQWLTGWRDQGRGQQKPMTVAHVKMEGAGLALQGSTRVLEGVSS